MEKGAFCGQVAIITGASSGIGKSLALQLASQGVKVALAARRKGLLEQVAFACRQVGGEALPVQTDVADESQCKALIERTVAKFGKIDILINNAGLATSALFDDFHDLDLFRHTMDVNFYGVVYCTYYAIPHLKATRGRIVVISSLGGKTALPYNTPYCSSKYALHGFCDTLLMELKPYDVSTTIICPSWVVSGFHEAQMDKNGIPHGEKGRAVYKKNMMTSDQCAQIVLKSAFKRRREVLMNPGWLVGWLKVIAPSFVDWLAVKLFLEPAIRRARLENIEVK